MYCVTHVEMLRCKACTLQVPNAMERRVLQSSSSEQVRAALEVCFTGSGCCGVAARQHFSSGYVCKKCFVLVDKKIRLEMEIEKVKSDLKYKIAGAIKSFALPEEPRSTTLHSTIYGSNGVLEVPAVTSAMEGPSGIDEPTKEQSASIRDDLRAHVEELNSPGGDGLFTVKSDPGSRATATPLQQQTRAKPEEREAQRRPDPGTNQTKDEWQWVNWRPNLALQRGGGGPTNKGRAPTHHLDVGAALRNLLADIEAQRSKERLQEKRARSAEVVSEGTREKVEPRVPPVDYGHQLVSGTLGEQWDSPTGSPTGTPKGQRSPEPDSPHIKLFVKPVPQKMTRADVMELFGRHGTVILLDYHPRRRDTLYITMDKEGGREAMAALNGKQLPGYHKPIIVQKYNPSNSLDNLAFDDRVQLFVKHVPMGISLEELNTLFSKHGQVHGIIPHSSRWNVMYVCMDPRGGQRAISALHGKAIAKNSTPLIVAVSHDPSPGTRQVLASRHSKPN